VETHRNMKTTQKNIKWLNKNGKSLFWSLACLLLAVTSVYIYLVNTAALNGVYRGKAEQNVTSVGATVSELESRYLSLKQSVTLSLAYARGFEDVKAVKFISTPKVGAVARVNEI